MSKWKKTRRDPGRTYEDEEAVAQLRKDVGRVKELVVAASEGSFDAEPEYVKIINRLDPEMTKERRKALIMQFRDAVSDAQKQRGRSPR